MGWRIGTSTHPSTHPPAPESLQSLAWSLVTRKLISLSKLMWQELPPDSRANKKFANAIYHFKKPNGYELLSAAARVIVGAEQPAALRRGCDDVFTKSPVQCSRRGRGAGGGAMVIPCKPPSSPTSQKKSGAA